MVYLMKDYKIIFYYYAENCILTSFKGPAVIKV